MLLAGSAVGSDVGGLVAGCLGGYGSSLVPGWIVLLLVCCLVEWHRDKHLLQGP